MPKQKSAIGNSQSAMTGHAQVERTTGSVEETQALGEQLGRLLQPGDVVALSGELGSGKTTMIQGIARGLGCESDRVKSPTFVLMREYPGRTALAHLDGYRLEGVPAAAWLDLDLIFSSCKVTVIEWAERFAGLLPEDRVEIHLDHVSANRRRIRVGGAGPHSQQLATELSSFSITQSPNHSITE